MFILLFQIFFVSLGYGLLGLINDYTLFIIEFQLSASFDAALRFGG
jgi:hypothetical protein